MSSEQRPLSTGSSSTRQSSPPPEIQKDGDSDFAELSTLDDIDVSDQLVRRKKVCISKTCENYSRCYKLLLDKLLSQGKVAPDE